MRKKFLILISAGIILIACILININNASAANFCSSGNLTTSIHKNFQGVYPQENFIRLNNKELLKDVSQLKDLACLQYLDVTDAKVTGDISALQNLTNLEVLSLYSTPDILGDICALSKATKMRNFKFAFNPKITGDIACLKDMAKLETFAMTHTQISGDISVFSNMPNLKALYISGTNIHGDICALKNLTNLQELGIADEYPGNPDITGDLGCLDNLKKLKRVAIYNTSATNCEQFTNSHSNLMNNPGLTESGKQGGGGCSEESMKTLVDYAQKFEAKIGKEVQTEVRGKPDYNKSPEQNAGGQSEDRDVHKNFIIRFINWMKSLFGYFALPDDNNPATDRDRENPNETRLDAGPGGCRTQTECDAYCNKPENRQECSNFKKPN
jgi:hypothetical protein